MDSTAIVSCHCGCATCVCGARVVKMESSENPNVESTIEFPPGVAASPQTEIMKGEQLTMPGDISSTDVVSSGFGGPWGFGGQASLKPAEVALVATNNPFNATNFLRDALTHESLRAEIKSVDAKVTAVTSSLAASEARRMQEQIDQLRMEKNESILAQILKAVSTTPTA